jgi:hypothetical protein
MTQTDSSSNVDSDRFPQAKGRIGGEVAVDLGVFSAFEVLQVLCNLKKSGYVDVRRGNGERASCWLSNGTVNHAECRRLRGREALRELLSWDGGAFCFYAGDGGGPATESIRFEELVLGRLL